MNNEVNSSRSIKSLYLYKKMRLGLENFYFKPKSHGFQLF